ncbi:MAG: hypothetical protein ACYTGR_02485 [Planctomycetota bacterium]|jgi:hypothetical protein
MPIRAFLATTALVTICFASPSPVRGGDTPCSAIGPDVIVGVIPSVSNYSSTNGIEAFSIGTTSCNIGDTELLWISGTNEHPVIAQNMFRLKDGRIEQIGQAWLKHGFFALQGDACGCGCIQSPNGSTLGVGCSDPYSSSLNGGQNGLGPKFEVNPATGLFPYPATDLTLSGNSVYKRLQVKISDLDPAQDGGGTYLAEAQYVTPDDSLYDNQNNNASYRAIDITGSGSTWSASFNGMPPTQREQPAIRAWQDADPSVVETDVQVPGDGLVIVAARATDLGSGWYHYEYAVQNLNSDRAIGSFSVPVDAGVAVANVGFHDVDYHSGEPFDGTDWAGSSDSGVLSWSTTPHATNPDANALRWGTLYNFRFDAMAAPTTGNVTLGLFKPGSPNTIEATTVVPDVGGEPSGACCLGTDCSVTSEPDCASVGGEWLGAGTTCAGSPCGCGPGEITDCFGNCAPGSWIGDGFCDDGNRSWNGFPIFLDCLEQGDDGGDCLVPVEIITVADADDTTLEGSILAGSYLDTHQQDDVAEVLREGRTGGPPATRRSLLSHTWWFVVAPGSAYTFLLDAHRSDSGEGDAFVFSYSVDGSTFTPMLTVTKTADDDQLQSYDFPGDVGGLLFIRVEDTDDTEGNGVRDTVSIDEMLVVTITDGPDSTPPSPPTGLGAASGNEVVNLDWTDNGEPDLAGYLVYRSEAGGPYVQLTPAPVGPSEYADSTVTNGTVYTYVVSAVDTASNESEASGEASAVPAPPGVPTSVHVAAIVLSTESVGGGEKRGRAEVLVLNDLGDPVAGASVTGDFAGDVSGTVTAATGADGIAVLLTASTARGNVQFELCVTEVDASPLNYDEGTNVETCDSR